MHQGIAKLVLIPHGWLVVLAGLILLALVALRVLYGVISFIFIYFLRPAKNLKFYGSWAVVTGASDGIGKAYCEELAKRGKFVNHTYIIIFVVYPASSSSIHTSCFLPIFKAIRHSNLYHLYEHSSGLNLVLISRTQSKLDDCADELKQRYKVQVKTVAADLCKIDQATLDRIGAAIAGLDVGLLINNAGSSYGHPEYLEQMPVETDIDLITINTVAPTLLAKLVLPDMKSRGRGIIINIGSANGQLPSVPLLSTYAGTKAYVDQFTRSLDLECKKSGIRVQNQPPMFVATKMSKIRRARLDAPTPQAWAKAAVKQIGYETTMTPFWFHGLMASVIKLAPTMIVSRHVLNLHLGFRAAYYRKQAKLQAQAAAEALDEAVGKKKQK